LLAVASTHAKGFLALILPRQILQVLDLALRHVRQERNGLFIADLPWSTAARKSSIRLAADRYMVAPVRKVLGSKGDAL
jgi:hypothetical protein